MRLRHHAAGINVDDDLLLDMIESITLDVLAQLGNDPDARYAFFKRFLALAQEVVGDAGKCKKATKLGTQP